MKKRKLNLTNYGHALGITSASLVAFIALALLCPAIQKDIYATEYCKGDNGYVECDATAKINTYARIAPVVSVGMQSDVVMDIVPKSSGVTIEQPVTVTVSTNSSEGYSLYMKTLDATNSMTSTSGTNTNVIAPVDGGEHGVDIATLASQGNVWGYSINHSSASSTETLYQAVPMSQDQPIRKTSSITETNATDTLELTFGLHVDTTLPSGTYTNKVLVSAVANPVTITNLSELVFMQDMTTDICSNTAYDATGETNPTKADIANPVTKQLIDTRDGKKYWVAKLADGNCWMTQNLALDLSTERTLTPADTDVAESWTPESETRVDNTISTEQNADGSYRLSPELTGSPSATEPDQTNTNYQYSWGTWKNTVLATPLLARSCLRASIDGHTVSSYSNEQLYNNCSGEGFFDTQGMTPTFTAETGDVELVAGNDSDVRSNKYPYTYSGFVGINTSKTEYDSHFLVGNYYQYNAATAGTGETALFVNAPDSICPKGWMLPRAGNGTGEHYDSISNGTLNSDNGTFLNLLNAYGLTKTISTSTEVNEGVAPAGTTTLRNYTEQFTSATAANGDQITYNIVDSQFNIAAKPLYLIRSGSIYSPLGDFLQLAGSSGYYTSATSGNTRVRYLLNFNSENTAQTGGGQNLYRSIGMSVRCLAR